MSNKWDCPTPDVAGRSEHRVLPKLRVHHRRLEERGGPPDPWDSTLKGVKWVELVDMLSEKWCKAAMARHHQQPLRLL